MILPPETPTLTMAYCRVLTDWLQSRGQALEPVLAALDVPGAALADPDRRVSRLRFNAALECAIEQTGDPHVGLHAGERVRPAHYGVVGYIMMSCGTSRQIIETHQRWHQLVMQGVELDYEEADGLLRLRETLPPLPGLLTRAAGECHAASMLSFARWVFGSQFRPLDVSFPYPEPAQLDEYRRIFQCPLRFDAPCFSLSIHNGLLDRPLPQADPELRQMMEAKAQRQAKELGLEADPFMAQLRAAIARLLPQAVPEMDQVAAALNISGRTLQRRLQQRGSHFKAAFDDMRRDLALGYVRDPQLSLVDIAFLLGFSQQSAFNRAFRRWTESTPGAYRDAL
ncbi:AraC family transcriptional regulator [Solimonas sp. K1W22B-7]|uniref:AraC family transcriptional regulator n=1 Tax=Solimonas sp. K1W22B-7 TaxID=2303331 RepID=UPI000E3359BD|nr:AraC family transcriptional regulator [Solimonas sp. K1W22B-7]AXQ30139.1 AraC family transcriptional regulator [Solimonas sp. K1W22B-7]